MLGNGGGDLSYWYFDGDTYFVEMGSDFYNKNCNCFIVKRRDGKEITTKELKENDYDDLITVENVSPEQDGDINNDYRCLLNGELYIPYYNGSLLNPNPDLTNLYFPNVIVGKQGKEDLIKPFCFIVIV